MRDNAHAMGLKLSNEYFRGEHSGFGPRHCREFILRDSSLIIYDMIETAFPNEINFNLSPEAEVIFLRERGPEEFSLKIENGGDSLTMSLEGFNKVESSSGYYSSGYGRRLKNTLVRCCRSKLRTSVEISFA